MDMESLSRGSKKIKEAEIDVCNLSQLVVIN